jgi:TolB-like protein
MTLALLLHAALLWTSPPAAIPAAAIPGASLRARTLAVLNFDNNTGRADYDAMGRGLAAMMISDLAVSPELRLVERERMQDVLKEQNMQRSVMFDSTTAVKAGRLLGAEIIATGSLAAAGTELRIDMRLIRVETGEIIKSVRAAGPEDKLFDLERQLAERVLKDLDIALAPESAELMRKRQEANRELGVRAFRDFSAGLVAMDNGDYVRAVELFRPLMLQSPDSPVVGLAYGEAKRRAVLAAKEAVKKKGGDALRGFFKKP